MQACQRKEKCKDDKPFLLIHYVEREKSQQINHSKDLTKCYRQPQWEEKNTYYSEAVTLHFIQELHVLPSVYESHWVALWDVGVEDEGTTKGSSLL